MIGRLAFRLFGLSKGLLGEKRFRDAALQHLARRFTDPSNRRTLDPVIRRVLRHSRGDEPSAQEVEEVLKGMASLYGGSLLDACDLILEELRAPGAARERRPAKHDLLPTLEGLLKGGRGAVLVSPHFGHYFGVSFLWRLRVPLTEVILPVSLARELAPKSLNVRFEGLGTAASACLKALADNEAVLVFSDMEVIASGDVADFFGAPVHPPSGAARLALAAQSPVLPVYPVYRGGCYHLECDKPILLRESTGQEEIEAAILRSMELFIGRHPEHWLLMADPWDLKRIDQRNRLQFKLTMLHRDLDEFLRSAASLFGAGS